MPRILSLFVVILPLLIFPALTQAGGFGINATRLIYPQGNDNISVTVRNTMTALPYLVQVSVSRSLDGSEAAPFVLRPPLFRLEPGSTNQIRIAAQGAGLPADRESVFYFHATAIPASTVPVPGNERAGVHGMTQFGVGNIIKLFYRPANLPASSKVAQQGLLFSKVNGGLEVRNPSAYFVSFATLHVNGQVITLDTPAALMLAPFSSHTYPISNVKGIVRWQTINDEGGINASSYKLP
jgi:fimbrial chaperone protein